MLRELPTCGTDSKSDIGSREKKKILRHTWKKKKKGVSRDTQSLDSRGLLEAKKTEKLEEHLARFDKELEIIQRHRT